MHGMPCPWVCYKFMGKIILLVESFPLGLRGIEGVTIIVTFNFNELTPPCPLLT
jgi:hypothetical protein